MPELILGDDSYLPANWFDGSHGRGLVPRDFAAHPVGSFAPPAEIPLIPRAEWGERIRAMEQSKSRLSDLRLTANGGQKIPSLDQGSWGYCWAHGPVAAATVLRAMQNQPYVPLSSFGVAYTIKQGRNEGAWGALALDFLRDRGIPREADWPRFDRRLRPATDPIWQTAKNYRVTGGWMELTPPVWDRDMTIDQVMTCLLNRVPVCADFHWWGHHVVLLDPVEVSPGRFGVRLWNSWGDAWENDGMAVLTDAKMIPDNAVAPAIVVAG
jgi:hypothetical protein